MGLPDCSEPSSKNRRARVRNETLRRVIERVILVLVLVAIAIVAVLAANVEKASAREVVLENGATFFENGTCVEADGTPGLSQMDGACVTAADYDEMFSYENLSTVETFDPFDGDTTVAEKYSIEPESRASERPRSFAGEQLDTFVGVVLRLSNGLYLL